MTGNNAAIMHMDTHSRVIFFQHCLYDGNDENNPHDIGIRMVFIHAESVASALIFGNFSQDGRLVVSVATIHVAGMSDLRSQESSDALVTEAHRLLSEYTALNMIEGVGVPDRDWLDLNSLLVNPIPYPDGIAVDTPTTIN